jgi:hypothetical protein
MIKLSLRAEKARALAKKLGIIPHPGSQWKWAVRKLRGKVGEELLAAERKIGKLPKADAKVIRTTQERFPDDEIALLNIRGKRLVTRGTPESIETLEVSGFKPSEVLSAHTHPSSIIPKIKRKLSGEELLENNRLLNKVEIASPSGRPHYYEPVFGKKFEAFVTNRIRIVGKQRNDSYFRAKDLYEDMKQVGVPKSLLRGQKEIVDRRYNRAMKTQALINSLIGRKFKMDPEVARSRGSVMPYRGDSDYKSLFESGNIESILAPGVEGVHKYRKNLPMATRSVYFEGGL